MRIKKVKRLRDKRGWYVKHEELLGPELVPNPLTYRLCRLCHQRLHAHRYFTCTRHETPEYWDLEVDYDYSELRRLQG